MSNSKRIPYCLSLKSRPLIALLGHERLRVQARQGAAIQKMFGSGIAKRIPRGVVAVGKRFFSIWATTPALRATPPVPGGEPEFETDPPPGILVSQFENQEADSPPES